jgi:hypothetical protein
LLAYIALLRIKLHREGYFFNSNKKVGGPAVVREVLLLVINLM